MNKVWWAAALAVLIILPWEASAVEKKNQKDPAGQMLAWLNRGEGLGQFRACEAREVKKAVWHVTLCVPEPRSVSRDVRDVMKPGVGLQAIFVLKELQKEYLHNAFVVWIKTQHDGKEIKYGFAFRKENGENVYSELLSYR